MMFDTDHTNLEWHEYDVLDLVVKQLDSGKHFKLRSYHEPARGVEKRKGVIFMVHGYGKGLRYSALIARNLAMAGYECFGIDGRGQGGSEGERGYMDNQEVLLSDQWCLIMEACKKYKIN